MKKLIIIFLIIYASLSNSISFGMLPRTVTTRTKKIHPFYTTKQTYQNRDNARIQELVSKQSQLKNDNVILKQRIAQQSEVIAELHNELYYLIEHVQR